MRVEQWGIILCRLTKGTAQFSFKSVHASECVRSPGRQSLTFARERCRRDQSVRRTGQAQQRQMGDVRGRDRAVRVVEPAKQCRDNVPTVSGSEQTVETLALRREIAVDPVRIG